MHAVDHIIARHLPDEAATLALGATLARGIHPGLVIWLRGTLGAGKTTLARGLLRGLGHAGRVKSPTYTLVEPYLISGLNLYHFDLYRFVNEDEWEAAGLRDYFSPHTVCLVEWPERATGCLPAPDIEISLMADGNGRCIVLEARTEAGMQPIRCVQDSDAP